MAPIRSEWLVLGVVAALSLGCGRDTRGGSDAGPSVDSSFGVDGALSDGGAGSDGGRLDGGRTPDSGTRDAGPFEAGPAVDAGADAGGIDAGPADAGVDSGAVDSGAPDTGPPSGGCISGAVGTHVARFRWNGTSSGSTAYVSYEANTLPDTSRWRAGAYTMSPTYRPVFSDPFLAEGGLDMSSSVFMDVELSTAGLPPVSRATVALYGRSFNTTTSGSFEWQTFDGTGATPSGSVSNAAPYRWYPGDATAALPAGNDGVLLRIRPGGPSGSLVVNRVEICFDTR